jgi:hypothetical protein
MMTNLDMMPLMTNLEMYAADDFAYLSMKNEVNVFIFSLLQLRIFSILEFH